MESVRKTGASAWRAAAPCCCGAGRAAVGRPIYLLAAGPTAANPQHAAAAGEWETDGRTPYRFVHPAAHAVRAVSKSRESGRSGREYLSSWHAMLRIEHSNSRFESIRFVMRIDSNRFVL